MDASGRGPVGQSSAGVHGRPWRSGAIQRGGMGRAMGRFPMRWRPGKRANKPASSTRGDAAPRPFAAAGKEKADHRGGLEIRFAGDRGLSQAAEAYDLAPLDEVAERVSRHTPAAADLDGLELLVAQQRKDLCSADAQLVGNVSDLEQQLPRAALPSQPTARMRLIRRAMLCQWRPSRPPMTARLWQVCRVGCRRASWDWVIRRAGIL